MEEHSEYQYPVVLDESKQAASFLNIEDMLFEVRKSNSHFLLNVFCQVFRSEDENHIDSIALSQFVIALENTGLRRWDSIEYWDFTKDINAIHSAEREFYSLHFWYFSFWINEQC